MPMTDVNLPSGVWTSLGAGPADWRIETVYRFFHGPTAPSGNGHHLQGRQYEGTSGYDVRYSGTEEIWIYIPGSADSRANVSK